MVHIRRLSQILFILLFLFLLFFTRFPLTDFMIPQEFFLKLDPFIAAATLFSIHALVVGFFLSLVLIAITIPFGRLFCGWVCPLGTTIDISERALLRRKVRPYQESRRFRKAKYFLLALLLFCAVLGAQIAGWFDPICLAERTYGMAILPAIEYLVRTAAPDSTYDSLFQNKVIGEKISIFQGQTFFAMVAVGIVGLMWFQRRFWCRNLCPLGAFLAVISKWRRLKVASAKGCDQCARCINECRMGALKLDKSGGTVVVDEECIQCFSCTKVCHTDAMKIAWTTTRAPEPNLLPARRGFLAAALGGVATIPFMKLNPTETMGNNALIRPPGALPEPDFLDACIRCGKCMKVCPTNGLQPLLFEGGLYDMWTPAFQFSLGYCDYKCTLCCQICPTGAIRHITFEVKQKFVMGTAFFDVSRCIPYADHQNCIKCEEHCPTPDKSIKFHEEVMQTEPHKGEVVKVPCVDKSLCIGCGICEYVCPVRGPAGIRVERKQDEPLQSYG